MCRYHYYFYFKHEETEAQRDLGTYPGSHSKEVVDWGFNSRHLFLESLFLASMLCCVSPLTGFLQLKTFCLKIFFMDTINKTFKKACVCNFSIANLPREEVYMSLSPRQFDGACVSRPCQHCGIDLSDLG